MFIIHQENIEESTCPLECHPYFNTVKAMKSKYFYNFSGRTKFCVYFLVVCASDYYGLDCNKQCGQCSGDDVCNNVTGYCPHGCKPHWNGTRCDGKYLADLYYFFTVFSIKNSNGQSVLLDVCN